MENLKAKRFLVVCLHLALQMVFSNIDLFGVSFAGLPFAIIKLFFDGNIFFVTAFYFVSKVYKVRQFKSAIILFYEIVFLTLYYFGREFLKTDKKRLIAILFLIFANTVKFYFSISLFETAILTIIEIVFEILTFVYFYKFFTVFKNKLMFYKFGKLDYFLFSIMVFLIGLGIFEFQIVRIDFCLFVSSLFIIIFAKLFMPERFFVTAVVLSVAAIVATGDVFIFEFIVISATIVSIIHDFGKAFYAAITTIVFVGLLLIFKNDNIFSYFSIIFAVFIYILIPDKVIKGFSDYLECSSENIILNQKQNKQIESVKERLYLMSDTLKSMQKSFKFLLVGKIDRTKAAQELSKDVIAKTCKECENFRYCFKENINKFQMFGDLLLKAIENKKVSINDLTNGLSAYCNKRSIVMSEVNQMAAIYLSYESAMKSQDESKLIISSELGNFSAVFENFAKNIKNSVKINEKLSKIAKEQFINSLIDVKEVVIFENENGIESISMIVKNEIAVKKEMFQVLSSVIKNSVQIKNIEKIDSSGFCMVNVLPKPKVKLEFAVASKAKEAKNGDSEVIVKISENKYFVAIADGMGHGETANKMSSMVLELVKSMFEVGLDDELVIESVNKLLIPAGLDNFTTIDAVVIDADKLECSFIKMGSSVSVIKRKNTSEIIKSQSLPMGIVTAVKPTIVKKRISMGDMIFLASDGVVDSFNRVEDYAKIINDAKIYHLQKFVDDVIFDAEGINQKHIDDMTIIGINLLKN